MRRKPIPVPQSFVIVRIVRACRGRPTEPCCSLMKTRSVSSRVRRPCTSRRHKVDGSENRRSALSADRRFIQHRWARATGRSVYGWGRCASATSSPHVNSIGKILHRPGLVTFRQWSAWTALYEPATRSEALADCSPSEYEELSRQFAATRGWSVWKLKRDPATAAFTRITKGAAIRPSTDSMSPVWKEWIRTHLTLP